MMKNFNAPGDSSLTQYSISIEERGVHIHARHMPTINYASYHCGTPIIWDIKVQNPGNNRSDSFNLEFQIQGYSDPCAITVPALAPGTLEPLRPPPIRLDVSALKAQIEAMPTQLTVSMGGRVISQATQELTILGFWSWSQLPNAHTRKTLAAFVSPNNSVVLDILDRTQKVSQGRIGYPSFGELLASGQDNAESLILESVYNYLLDSCDLAWCPPDTAVGHQRIRPPHHLFRQGLDPAKGQGTCIDLALLYASCLERVGLFPVIVLTGNEDGTPNHAFSGCWAGFSPGGRILDERGSCLQKQINSEDLHLVETTGFALGNPVRREKLAFMEAAESAKTQFKASSWKCLLDIGASRPKYGGAITPIDCAREAEVQKAYELAEEFAKDKEYETIETTFLFYGMLVVAGEGIRWLFQAANLNLGSIQEQLENKVRPHGFSGMRRPTGSYLDCQRQAEQVAWKAGSQSVREQDLLWALLFSSSRSKRLEQVCGRFGLDLGGLASLARKRFGFPETPESRISFASGIIEQ